MAKTGSDVDVRRRVRVVVVDDDAFIRAAVCLAFELEPQLDVVGEAGTVGQALSVIGSTDPEAVVLDYRLPDGDAPDLMDGLRERGRSPRVVVFTSYPEPGNVRKAIERGARAVLTKGPTDMRTLARAVIDAAAGTETLSNEAVSLLMTSLRVDRMTSPADVTPREDEVWYLLSLGKSNADIASELGVTERTAKYHVSNLLRKTGAESRAQLVSIAYRSGRMDRRGA